MERRKINKQIIKRILAFDPNRLQVEGVPIRNVTGDKALGLILGVHNQTIGAWRREGIIPFKPSQVRPDLPRYNIKDVIGAIKKHSLSDLDYAVKLAETNKELQMQQLQDRIKQLVERIDKLENGQKEK